MDENLRFIALLDELKARGLVSDYVAVAEKIGTNKAAISDIKGCRKKLSLGLLRSLKSSYPQVNLNWVIMGEGTMFVGADQHLQAEDSVNNSLIGMIADKDKMIRDQAEDIGQLKERNAQLERENIELRSISNRNLTPQDVERVFAEPNTVQKV